MNTQRTIALVVKSADFGESDKMVTLWTAQYGKITALMKGVRKPKAKLKPFALPLCCGYFELLEGKAGFSVTGCEVIDSFFDLAYDYEKFNAAARLLKVSDSITAFNQPNPTILTQMINFLRVLLKADEIDSDIFIIKFLMQIYLELGIKQSFQKTCPHCGVELKAVRKYDFKNGGIVCAHCADKYAVSVDFVVFSALRLINECDVENLASLHIEEGVLSALTLLNNSLTEF